MKTLPGLIVTYNPTAEFFVNLHVFLEQLSPLLVVDNGSDAETRQLLEQEARKNTSLWVQFNNSNLGIAAALNQGFRRAIDQGYEHIICFDQDSLPAPDMTAQLLNIYRTHPARERIAILAPQIRDAVTEERIAYLRKRGVFSVQRVSCNQRSVLEDIVLVVTSGSLNNLEAYQTLGGFCEDFFIDYVDTEYCLRARQHGYKIAVACEAILHHRLGNQQQKQIGSFTLRPTFHPPLRWYYIHRNRIIMLGLYALKAPYWALYDVMMGSYAFLKMILYEDQKLRKIMAVMMGTFDGLCRRMGPIAPFRKRWLVRE